MCGICGVAVRRGPVDPALLSAMNATLAHRGPDGEGQVVDGPVGLAMRRLAIIDPEGGRQPLANEDGSVLVVANGEIYDHGVLRDELRSRGHRFASRSDCEVLVHLYEEEGPDLLHRLRGMFAFALWDRRAGRLLLARDAFGIKPLYWRPDGIGGLAFGSELKALRADPGCPRSIDPAALQAFLATNSVPAPRTIHPGVHKLAPGHLLLWEGGRTEVRCWARPRPVARAALRREGAGALAQELRRRLDDSVRAQLVADRPVGVLLSGGVDSGALTALAAARSPHIATFSVGFAERSFDELDGARQVARRYATDHHEVVLEPGDAALLPALAEAFDEPMADSSALATWVVCRLAAQHVTVVLSGEGADELFGGYHTYAAHRLAARVGRPAALLAPLAARLPSSGARASLDLRLKRFTAAAALGPVERHHGFKELFDAGEREALVVAGDPPSDPADVLRARWAETGDAEPLARFGDLDVGAYLPDDLLVKVDRASMAHGLEARVPYLDPEVHALAAALPDDLRVRGLSKKRLLRQAVAPLLPAAVVDGPKRGFSIPAAAWLRGPLLPMARDVLAPSVVERQGVLRPEAVTSVLERHVSGQEDLSRELWGLLTFALWFERHLGPCAPAAGLAATCG